MDQINKILNKVQKYMTLAQNVYNTDKMGELKAGIFNIGDMVKNINSSCVHYGSAGVVTDIKSLPEKIGDVVYYRTTNSGEHWKEGDILRKTESQLTHANVMMMQRREPSTIMDMPETMSDSDPNRLQEPVFQLDPIPVQQDIGDDEMSPEESPSEVSDFSMEEQAMIMAVTSLKSVSNSLTQILANLSDPKISNNLTEPWLIGKIAVVEDYVNTIRTYVLYASEKQENNTEAGSRPGLWDNIRKKRERMGKKYKPAKPGDKGRPDPSQWNKLTKSD